MGSFKGKFFSGYAGHSTMTAAGKIRDYTGEAIRNVLAQVPLLDGVQFTNCSCADMRVPPNSIIYCDPPYAGVAKYEYSIGPKNFWSWCRERVAEGHDVFISEYNAPDDFVCVWEQKLRVSFNPGISKQGIEKLFVHKAQLKM